MDLMNPLYFNLLYSTLLFFSLLLQLSFPPLVFSSRFFLYGEFSLRHRIHRIFIV